MTRNVTIALDERTFRLARVAAAERGVSLSALVREYLQSIARKGPSAEALLSALDRAGSYRAASRLSRDQAHARRPA